MPLELDPGTGRAIGLEELCATLDAAPFDPRDEADLATRGPLLARLGRNRTFLAEAAIEELKRRCAVVEDKARYGPQVLMLRPANGRYVLRANLWPAQQDAALRASGPACFAYGLPHDHNFSFLTVGYLGSGYWSDYYDYDGAAVAGIPGEPAGLRFVERSRLSEGRLLLYRAHRDIHVQLPPDSFSVSLNILAYDPAQPWRAQYRFYLERGTIAAGLTTTAAEVLTTLAVHLSGGNGIGLARDLARRHPVPRMRASALRALRSAEPDGAEWDAWAAADPHPAVREA